MPLYLDRTVRIRLAGFESYAAERVLIPLTSGSFDGLPLEEAARRCRDDARHFPEDRTWVLRVMVP